MNDRVISFVIKKLICNDQMINIFGKIFSNIQFFTLNFGFVLEKSWNRINKTQCVNCTNNVAKLDGISC